MSNTPLYEVVDVCCDRAPNGSWLLTTSARDARTYSEEFVREPLEFASQEVALRFARVIAKSLVAPPCETKCATIFLEGEEIDCYDQTCGPADPARRARTRLSTVPHARCERAGRCVEREINPDVEACR